MRRTRASGTTLLVAAFIVTVLLVHPLPAQVATATLSGTIRDESGALLPGVSVKLTQVDTGIDRTVVTDEKARYYAPNLPLGAYQVRAELSGFKTEVRSGITLTVGRQAVVDFELKIGNLSEEVTVVGEASLVDTTSGSVGGLVDQKQIQELPLNGRSFGELTRLIPGVVRGSGATSFQGGFTDNISIRGGRAESNKILIDGTDVQGLDNKLPGSVGGLTLGVDAVREFKVEVGTYGAEFGRALGGVINVSSKSGTNAFHGNVFEFHRNDKLDAENFFDEEKPDFNRNQFGASLGGPIVRNKTHFFVNVEGLRDRLGFTRIGTVPNALARQGLIPNASGGLTNVSVAAAVRPYLDLWPLPNGKDFGDGRAELIQTASQPTDQVYASGRLDHRFSDNDAAFVRYTYDQSERLTPFDLTYMGQPERSKNQFVTFEEQKVFSPRLFNTFRVGFARNFKALDPGVSSLDISPPAGFVPGFRVFDSEILVTGLSEFGVADAPRVWATNKLQFSDQAVWRLGNHALKFGLELIRFQQNIEQNSNNGGEYQFTSLTNLLRGTSRRFRARLPGADQTRGIRTTYLGWYVQDDFTVAPRLTLNLGLRHEVHTGPTEVDGQCSNVDDIQSPVPRVGCPLFPTFAKNFAPRLGFAWNVTGTGKTALRGGAGLYYSEMSASSYYTSMTNQPPFTQVADVRNPTFPNAYAVITQSGAPQLRVNPNGPFTAVPSTVQFSLTLQQELAGRTVASVGYAGSIGRNWITRGQENVAQSVIQPDGRKFFPLNAPLISPFWGEVRRVTTNVDTSYHGLLVELRRRFSARFSAQAAYTFSKAIDTLPFTVSGDVLDFYDVERDIGLSDSDIRHNFSAGYVWELPNVSSPLADKFIGGWQVGGIVSLSSGRPFSPRVGFNISRDQRGNPDAERPNLAAGASSNPVLGGPNQYFDPMAFELQAPGFYGNVGRNTIIGPGFATVDFSLSKSFRYGGEKRLQFRAEVFNALNRANFGLPDPVVFDSSGRNPSAGRISTTVGTARQVQLGLKMHF